MFSCNCGKEFKTENGLIKHRTACPYAEINLEKIYTLGYMIDEVDRKMFHVPLGKIKRFAKENDIEVDQAKRQLQKDAIYKYRKSLWDILNVWKDELLASEYRPFIKWVWKTYKEITLLSMRNTLSNTKIIYRFNLENTAAMIGKRIDESLIHIHQHGEFTNDFEFVDAIMSGQVSMYYVLFNDWLASNWFGRLDMDLQKELEEYVKLASKTVLERLKHDEFELLQSLACTNTPKIYEFV